MKLLAFSTFLKALSQVCIHHCYNASLQDYTYMYVFGHTRTMYYTWVNVIFVGELVQSSKQLLNIQWPNAFIMYPNILLLHYF